MYFISNKTKNSSLENNLYLVDTMSINYCFQLTEIKKESKNENLYSKKNKTNIMLKKGFQMKLTRCYKLSIETILVFINRIYT